MHELERVLVKDLVAALEAVGDIGLIEPPMEGTFAHEQRGRPDLRLKVKLPDQEDVLELIVEVKREMYPRDARYIIEHLTAFIDQSLGGVAALPVAAAHHITASARHELRGANVNYFEASSGSLYFRYKTWLVDIERPSKGKTTRKVGSVFNGAREQVLHALLMHRHRAGDDSWLGGNELAVMADTSSFTVSKTLQELEKHDWVETSGAGPSQRRRLSKPNALLDAWADEWTRRVRTEPRSRWYLYAGPRNEIVDRVLEKLSNRRGWAMTGAAAANARLPHLTSVDRVQIIVPPGASEKWADELGFEHVEKGSNVTLIERTGASMMFLDGHAGRPGSSFTSPFIQYLDLLDGIGRNKELAREYRSQVLRMEERSGG